MYPSAPFKSQTERAPRGREHPRHRGASRPPPSSADAPHVELPSEDVSSTELSPRNLPVGVAIAIGPSPRKTRLELQSPGLGGATAVTRAQRCLTRSWQQLSLAKNQLRTKSEPLEPS